MNKRKKYPKKLVILQDAIKEHNDKINTPTLDVFNNTNKITTNINNYVDCNKYNINNICDIENSKFTTYKKTKDLLYKTVKYKLYPNDEQYKILINFCDAHIDMYNAVVNYIKNIRKEKTKQNQGKLVRYCEFQLPNLKELKKYFGDFKDKLQQKYDVNKHILDYSIKDCISMFKSISTNQKQGHYKAGKLHYLKKSKNSKIFKVEKMICTDTSFCSSTLGKSLKIIPNLNYKEDCETVYTIQYLKTENSFYLLRKVKVNIEDKPSNNNSITIDLGLRTLMTGMSENHILELGTNLCNELRKLYNKKEIIKKLNEGINKNNVIIKISKKIMNKKIKKLDNKIKNIINDSQWKIANYLTKNYNHVIIGNFSTKDMKKETNPHNLQLMKDLNMFNLREKIKYKCLLKNKKYIRIDEAYTTKCCNKCGKINEIGSSKIYECEDCKVKYDRDIKSCTCIKILSLI